MHATSALDFDELEEGRNVNLLVVLYIMVATSLLSFLLPSFFYTKCKIH